MTEDGAVGAGGAGGATSDTAAATAGAGTPAAHGGTGRPADMLHLGVHAVADGDRPAVVQAGTGEVTTYAELDQRSRRLAGALAARGLGPGGTIAVLLPNTSRYFDVVWAAQRAGLYYVPVNRHLVADEVAFIVADSGAQALVSSDELREPAAAAAAALSAPAARFMIRDGGGAVAGGGGAAVVDRGAGAGADKGAGAGAGAGAVPGFEDNAFEDFEEVVAGGDPGASPEVDGSVMFYSSGTTGRPRGIKRPLTGAAFGARTILEQMLAFGYGFDEQTVYLCPAPLYHAAPLGWSMGAQRLGGTVVVMERFDAAEMLALVERHRVTHVQMVPTMFVRLLKLPAAQRAAADLRSLRVVVHAAAPCPVEVKRQMMDWWGPILHEYYAGSEVNGLCAIGPDEWLAHPGSVGRAVFGELHIVGEDGEELPPGEIGTIYFGGTPPFEYHNDPEKTRQAFDSRGWSTLGDLGHVDDEGYLYLSDRRTNLIITGGVNVYPREVEDVLALHPEVADVAVVGLPDPEMGQQVVAVVEPARPQRAGPALEQELLEYCRGHLAHFKCPRTIRFDVALPRLATGKLAKHVLLAVLRAEAAGQA